MTVILRCPKASGTSLVQEVNRKDRKVSESRRLCVSLRSLGVLCGWVLAAQFKSLRGVLHHPKSQSPSGATLSRTSCPARRSSKTASHRRQGFHAVEN